MMPKNFIGAAFGVFLVFSQMNVTATVKMTGPQAAFRSVRVAMTVFAEDNDGQVAAEWSDLEPYLHMGGIEKWLGGPASGSIKLLANVRPETRIDGNRVVAILLVPDGNGSRWAAIENADGQIEPEVFTDEQIRNSGLNLAVTDSQPINPKSSSSLEPEEVVDGEALADVKTIPQPATASSNGSGETAKSPVTGLGEKSLSIPTWAIVLVVVAILGIVVLLLRARKGDTPR